MPGIHPDRVFLQGQPGDARVGTCYGHRSAHEYNKLKIAVTEAEEGRPVKLLWFERRLKNDDFISEFVVINGSLDPDMTVESNVWRSEPADGGVRWVKTNLLQRWRRVEEEGRSVFIAPDSYRGGPIHWRHHKDLGDERLVYESAKGFLDLGAIR